MISSLEAMPQSKTRGAKRRRPLVLWDGECGFCRRSIVWLRAHDRFGSLDFCPYQEADISPPLRAACEKALHVVKSDGEIVRAGRAMLFCGRFTRFHQLARLGEWPLFLPFVELGYRVIAANRGRISRLLWG